MNDDSPQHEHPTPWPFPGRSIFLNLAAAFQLGMVALALLGGFVLDVDPLQRMDFTVSAMVWSIPALLPMLLLLAVSWWTPIRPLREIREILIETLGPLLARCRWYDLLLLALLVGFSEEMLFRGLLLEASRPWGLWPAVLFSSLLFGLAHAVTRLYVILAGGLGVYLALCLEFLPPQSLVTPSLAHGLYDWVAFMIVRNVALEREKSLPVPDESSTQL